MLLHLSVCIIAHLCPFFNDCKEDQSNKHVYAHVSGVQKSQVQSSKYNKGKGKHSLSRQQMYITCQMTMSGLLEEMYKRNISSW
jgi:hypothetical protein